MIHKMKTVLQNQNLSKQVKQGSSQTNKQTDSEMQKLANIKVENILKEQKDMPTNRRTKRLTVNTHTQKGKQKMIDDAFCFPIIEINK